jgi:hypothetical protein
MRKVSRGNRTFYKHFIFHVRTVLSWGWACSLVRSDSSATGLKSHKTRNHLLYTDFPNHYRCSAVKEFSCFRVSFRAEERRTAFNCHFKALWPDLTWPDLFRLWYCKQVATIEPIRTVGNWGKNMGERGREWQQDGQNYIMECFILCTGGDMGWTCSTHEPESGQCGTRLVFHLYTYQ